MSVLMVLAELHRRGVSVTVDGDRLFLKPKRAVDAELLSRVREHKPAIIQTLTNRPTTCAPTCYEVEKGRWVHHPWDGCAAPMPKSAGTIVPAQADCGCEGSVCPRCWLCTVHCHCPPKEACWHCRGAGRCDCVTCHQGFGERLTAGACTACLGRGKPTKPRAKPREPNHRGYIRIRCPECGEVATWRSARAAAKWLAGHKCPRGDTAKTTVPVQCPRKTEVNPS